MEKLYNRTYWKNAPDKTTPLNAENLDNMEEGIDALDNRVVELVGKHDTEVGELKETLFYEVEKQEATLANGFYLEKLDWLQGNLNSSGVFVPSNTRIVTDFICTDNVEKYLIEYTGYACNWYWYDEEKSFISRNGSISGGYAGTEFTPNGKYFRIVMSANDTVSRITPSEGENLSLSAFADLSNLDRMIEEKVGTVFGETNTEPIPYQFVKKIPGIAHSDHTFIGNKLYSAVASTDDHSVDANVYVYAYDESNLSLVLEKTIMHNLGHVNTINYCEETDCLICGNGSNNATLSPMLIILPNVKEATSWSYDNAIKIALPNNWGIKCNVMWGEHNNGEYNIAYVQTNNNANVRKILLGKTDGVFDGTYTVLDSWELNTIDVIQGGTFYNGKLVSGIGHNGLWIEEITPVKGKDTLYPKQYKDFVYGSDGTEQSAPFSEALAIKNGYLFLGAGTKDLYIYKI